MVYLPGRWFYGKPAGDNPWDAKGLEWETTSPPPTFNFDRTPIVTEATHSYAPHRGGQGCLTRQSWTHGRAPRITRGSTHHFDTLAQQKAAATLGHVGVPRPRRSCSSAACSPPTCIYRMWYSRGLAAASNELDHDARRHQHGRADRLVADGGDGRPRRAGRQAGPDVGLLAATLRPRRGLPGHQVLRVQSEVPPPRGAPRRGTRSRLFPAVGWLRCVAGELAPIASRSGSSWCCTSR